MKILVIGSGGREHALVWKLAQSPHCSRIWCAPGNSGIAGERLSKTGESPLCVDIAAENIEALVAFARQMQPHLTVIGPDNPLALGIVDRFREQGLRAWGPNQSAARFESSKVFAQAFMQRHGIPTAQAGSFTDPAAARAFADSLGGRCAVKADGLALGKGVLICHSRPEAEQAIDELMMQRRFGKAGDAIVIQELLEGMEVSLHAICDGKTAKIFPTAQDHKRALDGDGGLNTGGMGVYTPTPFLSDAQLMEASDKILRPWLSGCAAEGIDFHGILYPGVMLTPQGPKVLEFNARFGDPEAQAYLPRLENDLVELLDASVDGTLDRIELRWSRTTSICVVMASGGYPGDYSKGKVIRGLGEVESMPDTKVFHAGTGKSGDDFVTSGGRVLGVTAWGASLAEARLKAYAAVEQIEFDGAQYRTDIGTKAFAAVRR